MAGKDTRQASVEVQSAAAGRDLAEASLLRLNQREIATPMAPGSAIIDPAEYCVDTAGATDTAALVMVVKGA